MIGVISAIQICLFVSEFQVLKEAGKTLLLGREHLVFPEEQKQKQKKTQENKEIKNHLKWSL